MKPTPFAPTNTAATPDAAGRVGWYALNLRMALRDWLALVIVLALMALALGWQNGLGRLDQALYDKFLSSMAQPVHDDIIIIAIDDFSLQQLGRWPWPRQRHAQLLDRLALANPRAVGLDVILTETDGSTGAGDTAMRKVLLENGRTVLPVVFHNPGTGLEAGLPIPALAGAARALGHINLEPDSDGVVRSVFLKVRLGGHWWPHFAMALAQPDAPVTPTAAVAVTDQPAFLQRADQLHIPFATRGQFQSVPYVAVLRGEVAPEFFTGKYVLVGATALGLGDAYPTPVSGNSGAMPGIEIHANILASLLDRRAIVIAPAWQTALFSTLPVMLALVGYLLFSPRLALLIAAGLLGTTVLLSYMLLQAGTWVAPAAGGIVLILSYPLWSWRRLEAAITYLGQEFIRLDHEPHLLPEAPTDQRSGTIDDLLGQRINAMTNAARRVRELRKFVSNSLDNLPDATLVTTVDGQILLANRAANDYFAIVSAQTSADLVGRSVLQLLANLQAPQPIDLPANLQFRWASVLDASHINTLASGIGATDTAGRDLLIKSAPCYSTTQLLTGWIVSVTDISNIRAAERSRDETLRFLSHDMRAPQASILALLELQEEPESALPQPEFFARIEKASRRTLGLADNFVQLARAESHEYRLDEVDFRDLLFDATDEMWSLAKNHRIDIHTDIDETHDYPVVVDRALMTRALTNLLSNAINYSPAGSGIICTLVLSQANPAQLACHIRDAGYGIAQADQKKLFHRFSRLNLPDQPRHDGIGLGLVFVKTVVERHLGQISFVSLPGEGTCFTLLMPCQPAATDHSGG